jgi:hypothetical protein
VLTRTNRETIPFDEAVIKLRAAFKEKNRDDRRNQMNIGKIAAHTETKYRDQTIAKLATKLGCVSACTLKRHVSVYNAWDGMGIEAPGPVSYSVLRALQDHPDREQIVEDNPQITKREAEELRRKYEGKPKNTKSRDWKAEERKHWLRGVYSFANRYGRDAEAVMRDKEVARAMRDIAEPELLAAFMSDLRVLLSLAEHLKEAEGVTA